MKVLLVLVLIINVCLVFLVLNTRQDRQLAYGQVAMKADRFLAVSGASPFDADYIYVIDNRGEPRIAVFLYDQNQDRLMLLDSQSLEPVFGE